VKGVGHSLKYLSPSQKTLRPTWCSRLVTGLSVAAEVWQNFGNDENVDFFPTTFRKSKLPLFVALHFIFRESVWKPLAKLPVVLLYNGPSAPGNTEGVVFPVRTFTSVRHWSWGRLILVCFITEPLSLWMSRLVVFSLLLFGQVWIVVGFFTSSEFFQSHNYENPQIFRISKSNDYFPTRLGDFSPDTCLKDIFII